MRIWHLDADAQPDAVDGVTSTVWRLAAAQARLPWPGGTSRSTPKLFGGDGEHLPGPVPRQFR